MACIRRVLGKSRLIFPPINGPIVYFLNRIFIGKELYSSYSKSLKILNYLTSLQLTFEYAFVIPTWSCGIDQNTEPGLQRNFGGQLNGYSVNKSKNYFQESIKNV